MHSDRQHHDSDQDHRAAALMTRSPLDDRAIDSRGFPRQPRVASAAPTVDPCMYDMSNITGAPPVHNAAPVHNAPFSQAVTQELAVSPPAAVARVLKSPVKLTASAAEFVPSSKPGPSAEQLSFQATRDALMMAAKTRVAANSTDDSVVRNILFSGSMREGLHVPEVASVSALPTQSAASISPPVATIAEASPAPLKNSEYELHSDGSYYSSTKTSIPLIRPVVVRLVCLCVSCKCT